LQTLDRVVQVRPSDDEVFRTRGQGKAKRKVAHRFRGRADSLGGMPKLIHRTIHAPGHVFNRAANKPGLRGELDGFRYDLRGVSEAILEIGADRQVGRRDHGGHVGHGFVTTNGAVGLPDGEGITSTGGG